MDDTAPWQGDVPDFSNLLVRARYFGNNTWSGDAKASANWAGDRDGYVNMPGKAPAEGTWPYVANGRNVIPLGSFDWTEVRAPIGYAIDSTVRRCKVAERDDVAYIVPGDGWIEYKQKY